MKILNCVRGTAGSHTVISRHVIIISHSRGQAAHDITNTLTLIDQTSIKYHQRKGRLLISFSALSWYLKKHQHWSCKHCLMKNDGCTDAAWGCVNAAVVWCHLLIFSFYMWTFCCKKQTTRLSDSHFIHKHLHLCVRNITISLSLLLL